MAVMSLVIVSLGWICNEGLWKRTMPSRFLVPVTALLAAALIAWLVSILNGTENANKPRHPWNIQLEAERRCVNGVHRDLPMPATFRFRRQGDSIVGEGGWKTSFQFTTTKADGRHFRHTANCEVSLEGRRGRAMVTTTGETGRASIEFAW